MKVEEYVIKILHSSSSLSNKEIAEKVRKRLGSKTTAQNISWYRSKHSKKPDMNRSIPPRKGKDGIDKFKDCYINGSPEGVYAILSPEARNIVQNLFKSKKRGVSCEYMGCRSHDKEIQACHIRRERKEILEDAIKESKTHKGYDVYKIFKIYKEQHQPKIDPIIRLLCRKHHVILDGLKKKKDSKGINKFLKHLN